MRIRKLVAADWDAVRRIYEEGIATGRATFETEAPTWARWDAKHHSSARLVASDDEGVLGWAALAPVSDRPVYAGVAEVSVYVAERARRQGVGCALLTALIAASESRGIWTLQAALFPENGPSIALHSRCGFRVVGYRERIGRLHGVWHDNLLLERRSSTVGTASPT